MQQKKKLSDRQKRMIEFIREFMLENGRPPTVRDIQKACDISSTSVVDYNLRLLQREGYLNRRPDVARGIELLGEDAPKYSNSPATRRVPVFALIPAGPPLPVLDAGGWTADDALDTIDIPTSMFWGNKELYALKVRGTSMIDALVDDGDIVLVEPLQEAPNGTMVVARLRLENETTLKHLYHEGDRVRLQPANSTMDPIYSPAENVEVQGKVVGVIRSIGKM
jgi:repressor LexA